MKRVMVILGTRSEMVKLAPVIIALQETSAKVNLRWLNAGQHPQLVRQAGSVFGLVPDREFQLEGKSSSLIDISQKIGEGVSKELDHWAPDLVIVQGDSLSAVLGSQQAFYRRIPIVHLASGARMAQSTAAETNGSFRRMLSAMANFHCVPTATAANGLRAEGFPISSIGITGNTAVDALQMVSQQPINGVNGNGTCTNGRELSAQHKNTPSLKGARILVAMRYQDILSAGIPETAFAIANLAHDYPGLNFIIPLSPDIQIQGILYSILNSVKNIKLQKPMNYLEFVREMEACDLIMTDSGDIQDEASALAKPVLIMRETTDRPELIQSGGGRLIGSTQDSIVNGLTAVLGSPGTYRKMAEASNPYGDGRASHRIARLISNWSRNNVLTPRAFEPFGADQKKRAETQH
jgi:UDP-N-acetylglucosamine 2-epimerase (non-hydrolysing)